MTELSASVADFRLSKRLYIALVLLWAVLTLAGLGIAPLFDYDEASYAETAVEMRNSGSWLLPVLNGQPYYDKPAFVYYCMNASFALFGKNAFAARLPSSLFTLALALLLLHVGRRLGMGARLNFSTTPKSPISIFRTGCCSRRSRRGGRGAARVLRRRPGSRET